MKINNFPFTSDLKKENAEAAHKQQSFEALMATKKFTSLVSSFQRCTICSNS